MLRLIVSALLHRVLGYVLFVVEVLLYVHRNRRFIRDGSPGRMVSVDVKHHVYLLTYGHLDFHTAPEL